MKMMLLAMVTIAASMTSQAQTWGQNRNESRRIENEQRRDDQNYEIQRRQIEEQSRQNRRYENTRRLEVAGQVIGQIGSNAGSIWVEHDRNKTNERINGRAQDSIDRRTDADERVE